MSTWRDIDAFLKAQDIRVGAPSACSTDGNRQLCPMHVADSNHYRGIARDYGDAASDCRAIVSALLPFAGMGGPIIELFYAPTNTWRKNGQQLSRAAIGDHDDHVHAAIDPNRTLSDPPAPAKPDVASSAAVFWPHSVGAG